MTIQECYKKMGADYQEVLGRLHNEAMIGRFVRMFLQDDSFQILEEALRRGDVKEAFRGAHTLKGVCQNLGFSNLYAPTYTLTETLRAGQLEGTQEQFAKVALHLLLRPFSFVPISLFLLSFSAFLDRKSTRLNSSHVSESRMPSSA